MQTLEFLDRLEAELVPRQYRTPITKNVPDSWRFYRKGPYVFAAVPYAEVPANDYGNMYVKSKVKEIVFALPLVAEKGLFLAAPPRATRGLARITYRGSARGNGA